jgi:hypothetical protein
MTSFEVILMYLPERIEENCEHLSQVKELRILNKNEMNYRCPNDLSNLCLET